MIIGGAFFLYCGAVSLASGVFSALYGSLVSSSLGFSPLRTPTGAILAEIGVGVTQLVFAFVIIAVGRRIIKTLPASSTVVSIVLIASIVQIGLGLSSLVNTEIFVPYSFYSLVTYFGLGIAFPLGFGLSVGGVVLSRLAGQPPSGTLTREKS